MVKHPIILPIDLILKIQGMHKEAIKIFPSRNQEQSLKKDPSPTVVRHCGIPYQMQ